MKIGIITDLIDEKCAGIGKYTYNLINNINKIDYDNDYSLIHYKRNNFNIYKSNEEIIIPSVKPFESYLWRGFILPLNLMKKELDIVHDPADGIGTLSFEMPFKKIITVHDLIPHIFPEYVRMTSRIAHRMLYKRTLHNADKIITDSYSSKKDIIKYFDVLDDKIKVIYIAADEKYKILEYEALLEFKKRYKINFPFILYVGALDPKKNVLGLVKAFYMLKKKGSKHKLIIAGNKGYKFKEICKLVEKMNLNKEILFMGYFPEEDLPKLYNAADLFIFPSFYEGFGLPLLEAMSCGTPVITSNISSMPEIVGDASILIDPYDVEDIFKSITNLLNNNELKDDLIKKGLIRAKMFSWKKTAEETLQVYENVYSI